jgi:uncharacterized protein
MFCRALARLHPRRLTTTAAAMPSASGGGGIITDAATISAIARDAKRVAVIGIRPHVDTRGRPLSDRPAHFVPAALIADGVEVIPVPVPMPEAEAYWEQPARTLEDLAGLPPVDVAVFFRRPDTLPPPAVVIAARPVVVWLQSGISNREWEQAVAGGGVRVVADRCIKVERARAAKL